jgi:hypothetical protein
MTMVWNEASGRILIGSEFFALASSCNEITLDGISFGWQYERLANIDYI